MNSSTKFELEFVIHASPQMLYQYISTASGLSEWFADDVHSRGPKFSFFWNGSEEVAKLIKHKNEFFVRFKWEATEGDDSYFEMKILEDEITSDVSLVITDFSDPDEIEESKMLWENQISSLKQILGSV